MYINNASIFQRGVSTYAWGVLIKFDMSYLSSLHQGRLGSKMVGLVKFVDEVLNRHICISMFIYVFKTLVTFRNPLQVEVKMMINMSVM